MTGSPIFWDTPYAKIEAVLAEARQELRRYWAGHLCFLPNLSMGTVCSKQSTNLRRTAEDIVCESIIRAALSQVETKTRIIFEDDEKCSKKVLKAAFLVDPLDGTHNALMGYPIYSTSISFFHDNKFQFAWVYDISRDLTFVAVAKRGAYIESPLGIRRLKTTERSSIDEMALGLMRCRDGDRRFALLISSARKIRLSSCSSLDLCFIASGALDGFVDITQPGHQRSCDIAAAALILEEAGGVLLDLNGNNRHISGPSRRALEDFSPLIGACSPQAGRVLVQTINTLQNGRRLYEY